MDTHGIWPAGSSAPEPLSRLLEYAERNQGLVVGDFRVDTALQPDLLRWFQGDRKMARPFSIFGIDGDRSLYGFWFYSGVAPEQAPVVRLQGDGSASAVLATGIESFLSLLAAGRTSGDERGLPGLRAWLKSGLRLSPAKDAEALVRQAQAAHPDLQALITEWAEKNATLEGQSAEGWPPYRRK